MTAPDKKDAQLSAPTARGQRRRQAVLDAALALFLKQGFAATSVDSIIDVAGGSRRTIYQMFGGKDALLEAAVVDSCEAMLSQLNLTGLDQLNPRDALTSIGEQFLGVLMQPLRASLFRLVVAESTHAPELGRRFMEAGPQRAHAVVCAYLEQAVRQGKIEVTDLPTAAAQFLEMVKGDLHFRALFYSELADAERQRQQVKSAVDIFLDGTLPK